MLFRSSTSGKGELLNITLRTCGSSHDSTTRKAKHVPHRTNGRRRSQRRGTTQWTPPQDGLKPVPPTRVHPLMMKNAKSYERKDDASDVGSKGISVVTALRSPRKHEETHRRRTLEMKRSRQRPPNHPQSRQTHFWSKKRPQLRTSFGLSLMPRMM